MSDLLLPRTDAGVLAQTVIVAVVTTVAVIAARHRPDLRLLAIGAAVSLAALFGLRAMH